MKNLTAILIVLGVLIVGIAIYTNRSLKRNNGYTPPAESITKTLLSKNTSEPTEVSPQISLEITSPQDKLVVNSSTVRVQGKTSSRAEVFVNGESTRADSKGNFSYQLVLDEGENIVNIVANDSDGNFVEKEITVEYSPQ